MAEEIQGGTVAEVAAPQTETQVTDKQTVETGVSKPVEGTPAAAGQDNGTQTQQPAQTPEQNSQFAAARREAEAALKAERDKFNRTTELIKNYGATNGCFSDADVAAQYGAQGINTLEDLAAEVERQNTIQTTGVDPKAVEDVVNKLVQNNPLFKSMQDAQNRSAAEKALSDFKADFPDVQFDPKKGLEQFENADGMKGYLEKGLSLSEAYSLANRKAIQSHSAAAARQQTLNDINSKSHIQPTGAESLPEGEVEVPEDVMAVYKRMPQLKGWTDSQIRKQYAKRHSNK